MYQKDTFTSVFKLFAFRIYFVYLFGVLILPKILFVYFLGNISYFVYQQGKQIPEICVPNRYTAYADYIGESVTCKAILLHFRHFLTVQVTFRSCWAVTREK